MIDTPLSVLEFSALQSGSTPADLVAGAVHVAQRVEKLGYRRVWYAEHHSARAVADFPPALVVAHVATATSTIRLGSGGALAPNHSPLSLAEQFGTLATFHPGRIDMGIGRGPGTFDQATVRALRRGAAPATDEQYGEDVAAILQYTAIRQDIPEPWMLASSTAGAGLAARLGLPLAFAYHRAPEKAAESLEHYRKGFTPSRWCETPRVMLSITTICADTDAAAVALSRPMEIVRAAMATGNVEQALPDPETAAALVFTAQEEDALGEARMRQAVGAPATVGRRLTETADRFGADELMLLTPVYDWRNRSRSFELVAQIGSR